MKKRLSILILNILISCDFLLLIAGFLFLYSDTAFFASQTLCISLLVLQILCGFLIQLFAVKKSRKAYQLMLGSVFFSWGFLSLAVQLFPELRFVRIWPLFLFFPGLSLLTCGYYRYKKFTVNIVIPALIIMVMSVWYLLFSLKIIKVSFKKVTMIVAPFLIVGVLLLFILLYFLQKKNKQFIIDENIPTDFENDQLYKN